MWRCGIKPIDSPAKSGFTSNLESRDGGYTGETTPISSTHHFRDDLQTNLSAASIVLLGTDSVHRRPSAELFEKCHNKVFDQTNL